MSAKACKGDSRPLEATENCTCKCCSCEHFFLPEECSKQGSRKTAKGAVVETFRCLTCNRVKNRVGLVISNMPKNEIAAFKEGWDKVDKPAFKELAKDAFGDDLAKLITDQVSLISSRKQDLMFKGTGEFMDEEDMKEKYAKKPKQLEARLKNCKRIWDPEAEVELLEDMKYVSSNTVVDSHLQERRMSTAIEEKAPKKPRVAKPKAAAEGESIASTSGGDKDLKTLTAAQLKHVASLQEFVKKQIAQFEDLKAAFIPDADDDVKWAVHVPAWVMQKLEASICEANAKNALLEVMADTHNLKGDFKTVKEEFKELKANWKGIATRSQLQIDEAKKV